MFGISLGYLCAQTSFTNIGPMVLATFPPLLTKSIWKVQLEREFITYYPAFHPFLAASQKVQGLVNLLTTFSPRHCLPPSVTAHPPPLELLWLSGTWLVPDDSKQLWWLPLASEKGLWVFVHNLKFSLQHLDGIVLSDCAEPRKVALIPLSVMLAHWSAIRLMVGDITVILSVM